MIRDHSGKTLWRHKSDGDPNPYQTEHDKFYEAIQKGTPLNNAHYGVNSSFTSVLGRYATYSGKEIGWDEALACNLRLSPESFGADAQPLVLPDASGNYPIAIPGSYAAAADHHLPPRRRSSPLGGGFFCRVIGRMGGVVMFYSRPSS